MEKHRVIPKAIANYCKPSTHPRSPVFSQCRSRSSRDDFPEGGAELPNVSFSSPLRLSTPGRALCAGCQCALFHIYPSLHVIYELLRANAPQRRCVWRVYDGDQEGVFGDEGEWKGGVWFMYCNLQQGPWGREKITCMCKYQLARDLAGQARLLYICW